MSNTNTPRFIKNYPLSQLFVRFFTGAASGSAGALILGSVMLTTWSFIGSALDISTEIDGAFTSNALNPISIILIGISIFLATMLTNIVYSVLASVVDDKYAEKRAGIAYVFIGGLLIATIMIPVYLYLSITLKVIGIGISGLLHAVLFNLYTIIALEIVNRNQYLIISLIGALLGIALFTIILSYFITNSDGSAAVAVLLALPLLSGCMSISNTMIEGIYGWFYRTYGTSGFTHL